MNVILDAGAFVAVERRDRRIGAMLRVLQQRRVRVRTSAAVVAQVWRDGRKQVHLARLIDGVAVVPLGPENDRRTGELLGRTRTSDVIDAHLALCVEADDLVLTSDEDDLDRLVSARGIKATLVGC